MARRQNQMLGDPMMDINCEEYKPLPVGYANSKFVGMIPNPMLDGVKTPKYQVSAPRPVSADVMAVNMAQRLPSMNRAATAQEILQFYIKEGKEWRPPKVSVGANGDMEALMEWVVGRGELHEMSALVMSDAKSKKEFLEEYYGLVSGPRPRLFRGNTRGQELHKQTIATQVEPEESTFNADKYLARWNKMGVNLKNEYFRKIEKAMLREGVNMSGYTLPGGYVEKAELDRIFSRALQVIPARGVNIDLDGIFGIQATEQALAAANPQHFGPQVPTRSVSEGAGPSTSTALSRGMTVQQGTALPETTQTTQEVQKK